MTPTRLSIVESTLLVIDVQEKLLPKIPGADSLVDNVCFLIDSALLLQVPLCATEQYPQGLGSTQAEIARRLPAILPGKVTFSCCGTPGLVEVLRASGRSQVVLCGMESHVCVLQTALDLLAEGMKVFFAVDAVQARDPLDHVVAMRRLELAGAIPTTVETVVFEWLGSANHPQFKTISKMIQKRMARNGPET